MSMSMSKEFTTNGNDYEVELISGLDDNGCRVEISRLVNNGIMEDCGGVGRLTEHGIEGYEMGLEDADDVLTDAEVIAWDLKAELDEEWDKAENSKQNTTCNECGGIIGTHNAACC